MEKGLGRKHLAQALRLGPLAKAMKIHEIYITADGVVKSKNLPTDLYYDNVKITESRRYKRVETVE